MSTEPWSRLELELDGRVPVDPAAVVLLEIAGAGAISRPYEYELTFEVRVDGGLAPDVLDELLRRPCVVRWGPNAETLIHGVMESIVVESVADIGRIRYRARLVPRLARLAHMVRSRVFQDVDLAGLVGGILEEHQLRPGDDFELQLTGSYPTVEYVVQYQESDLDFVSRWLEHHGVHYHFVQEDDRERLVIADSNRGLTPYRLSQVAYVARGAAQIGDEAVHTLERRLQVGAQKVLLTDFNWRTPQVLLSNLAPADEVAGYGLHQIHGEHYKTPAEGAELARARSEQVVSERVRYTAEVTLYELEPGHWFRLVNHLLGEYERDYLVVRSELRVKRGTDAGHHHVLELAEHDHPYRPPRRTPRPRIVGVMHGRIDAPAHSTAAPIDEHGRYKVLLPFDLNGQPGGQASRWIRVAQPSSGPGYGVHVPMHLGAEVAIAHLGGDPDRPVIVGAVHNADTPNPVSRDNSTQSWVKTQAGIRVLFDDDVQ